MSNENNKAMYFASYTTNEWDEKIIVVEKGGFTRAWIVEGWYPTDVPGSSFLSYSSEDNEIYFDLMSVAMKIENRNKDIDFAYMPLNKVMEDIIAMEEMEKMQAILNEDLPF